MASAREQIKMIEAELARVRAEIEKLRIEEALLLKMKAKMNGEPEATVRSSRTRSPNVKPTVLEIMNMVGANGATTSEVDEIVRLQVPSVAKDTVGSVLSRLKSDGVLVYSGERYFEKQFAPKPEGIFDKSLRAVS